MSPTTGARSDAIESWDDGLAFDIMIADRVPRFGAPNGRRPDPSRCEALRLWEAIGPVRLCSKLCKKMDAPVLSNQPALSTFFAHECGSSTVAVVVCGLLS
jgi:hypothetical protein